MARGRPSKYQDVERICPVCCRPFIWGKLAQAYRRFTEINGRAVTDPCCSRSCGAKAFWRRKAQACDKIEASTGLPAKTDPQM